MIYAFDFDGTLAVTDYPDIIGPIPPVVEFAKSRKRKGHKIILWTCREGDDLLSAVNWCKSQGLEFDAINDNILEQKGIYACNSRKVYADVYIDDHNMKIFDVLSIWRDFDECDRKG